MPPRREVGCSFVRVPSGVRVSMGRRVKPFGVVGGFVVSEQAILEPRRAIRNDGQIRLAITVRLTGDTWRDRLVRILSLMNRHGWLINLGDMGGSYGFSTMWCVQEACADPP